jgi:hypothetical protein
MIDFVRATLSLELYIRLSLGYYSTYTSFLFLLIYYLSNKLQDLKKGL